MKFDFHTFETKRVNFVKEQSEAFIFITGSGGTWIKRQYCILWKVILYASVFGLDSKLIYHTIFNFKANDNFIIISGLVMALIGSLFSLLVVRNALTLSISLIYVSSTRVMIC